MFFLEKLYKCLSLFPDVPCTNLETRGEKTSNHFTDYILNYIYNQLKFDLFYEGIERMMKVNRLILDIKGTNFIFGFVHFATFERSHPFCVYLWAFKITIKATWFGPIDKINRLLW